MQFFVWESFEKDSIFPIDSRWGVFPASVSDDAKSDGNDARIVFVVVVVAVTVNHHSLGVWWISAGFWTDCSYCYEGYFFALNLSIIFDGD